MFFQKKKSSIGSRIAALFKLGADTDEFYDELEEIFLESDIGPRMTNDLLDQLRELGKKSRLRKEDDLKEAVLSLVADAIRTVELVPERGKLSCFLVFGVNGVGKTTTIAKLAHWYRANGHADGIVLAAGDTFRAAAVQQLGIHGDRLGIRVVSQGSGADPGAVLYDALESAKARGDELVIADTAGRLHNKAHLVKELQKIDKIVGSKLDGGAYRKLLVLDATTGQNGLQQAQVFHEALGIDAVILTKYDSTAGGGLAVSVSRTLGLPFAFIGTGEKMSDFAAFDATAFARELVRRIL